MGVLRQKCVPTYDSFLNSSNFSSIGFNISYKSYLEQIDNESMFIEITELLDNLVVQLIGIKKMHFMFFVAMPVEVQSVLMVMFVGKIEA